MVERLTKKIIVVDLDGTLYRGSTLRRFVAFGLSCAIKRVDVAMFFPIIWQLILNRLGLRTHVAMKHSVVNLIESKVSDADIARFADSLASGENDGVRNLIEREKNAGDTITVLSTASPMSYAGHIARRCNFDKVYATETTPSLGSYTENRGTEKYRRIAQLIEGCNAEISVVITDHHDDLELMRHASEGVYLISPSDKTVEILKSEKIAFHII